MIQAFVDPIRMSSTLSLPSGFVKSTVDLLLEAAMMNRTRDIAVHHLLWLGSSPARASQVQHDVLSKCAHVFAHGTLRSEPPSATQDPRAPGEAFEVDASHIGSFPVPADTEKQWQKRLLDSHNIRASLQVPPVSTHATPDRNPLDGIVDTPSAAVWGDPSGIAAQALSSSGFEVLWSHAPPSFVNPYQLPAVDFLLAYPDRTPFHASGAGLSGDTVADTCSALLALPALRPLVAVFEFSAAIVSMHKGRVSRFVEACCRSAGYRLVSSRSNLSHFTPMPREVLVLTLTRNDVAESWATPARRHPVQQTHRWPIHLPLDLPSHLLVDQSKHTVTWLAHPDSFSTVRSDSGPVQVAWIKSNTCGNRVYMHKTPALKSSTFGVGGNTHLLAQLDSHGHWQIRKLTVQEITEALCPVASQLQLPPSPLQALAVLARAPASTAVSLLASSIRSFLRPRLTALPSGIQDIIQDVDIHIFRANMQRMHDDFAKMKAAQ